jgi:PAS domain S-box-containing protein
MFVISESLEEQAALYASGSLSAAERAQFDLVLRFHTGLREMVKQFEEVAVSFTIATQPNDLRPSKSFRNRLMAMLDDRVQQAREEGFVMAGPDGLVEWVNESFTAMCGYSLEELKGKKLGPILQGEKTDKEAAIRMRDSIRAQQQCTEALVNYHKNGTPYWVSINITPIRDSNGELLCFIARELELPERPLAVA